jgi:hypothetical protein
MSGTFSPIQKQIHHIFVFEDEMWKVKIQFSQAINDDTLVYWKTDNDGNLVLHLLVVGVILFVHIFLCWEI